MDAKKVLALCYHPLYPANFGSAVRNYEIVKQLSARYRMYVVCPSCIGHENKLDITLYDFAKHGIRNQVLDFQLLGFMWSLLKKEGINIIFQKDLYCGFYGLLLHLATGIPLYLDEHNVEFMRLQRTRNPYWWAAKIVEKIICHFSKEIFCVSELDKELVVNHLCRNRKKVKVIRNGFEYDEHMYQDLNIREVRSGSRVEGNEKVALFFGNLYYQPNVEAIRIIFDEILPRIDGKIDYKVWIMGKGELPEDIRRKPHPRVIFLGEKPDVYPYILASNLIIVPLVSGGGTRVKIIETIATGKQVLSTGLGAEGIEREGLEENLVIEDDWDQFANQIIRLLMNSHDRLTIPHHFVDKFRWEKIAEKIKF